MPFLLTGSYSFGRLVSEAGEYLLNDRHTGVQRWLKVGRLQSTSGGDFLLKLVCLSEASPEGTEEEIDHSLAYFYECWAARTKLV